MISMEISSGHKFMFSFPEQNQIFLLIWTYEKYLRLFPSLLTQYTAWQLVKSVSSYFFRVLLDGNYPPNTPNNIFLFMILIQLETNALIVGNCMKDGRKQIPMCFMDEWDRRFDCRPLKDVCSSVHNTAKNCKIFY